MKNARHSDAAQNGTQSDNLPDTSQGFAAQYSAALSEYLVGGGETALSSAYELGRQALEYDTGMLVVADAHHTALQTVLLSWHDPSSIPHILTKAAEFFSECISSFEMSQRGFRESVTLLRNMNEILRGQQRDLSLLLLPMPNLLLTIDEHDRLAAFFIPPDFPPILKACRVGLELIDVLPAEIGTSLLTTLPQVHELEQTYRLEFAQDINGKTLYFDLQLSPVPASRDVLLVIDHITERKEMELAEHRQRVLAEALRDIAMTLNSSLDLDEILDRIFAGIGQVVPHDSATIMLFEEGIVRVVRSFGYDQYGHQNGFKPNSEYQLSAEKTPKLYHVTQRHEPTLIPDLALHLEHYASPGFGTSGSGISVPMMFADLVIGIINLSSIKLDFFTPAHVENLQLFANHAAIAIQNAQTYAQAQEIAAHNERQRLARDLHDSVSQSLFAASSIAESATKQWERNPDKVFPMLLDIHQLLRGSMAEMRILLWELRPANIINTPLDKLITQLVNAYRSRTHMTLHCETVETQELPEDVHVAFYRITQESLNNIVKHSQATEARIELAAYGEEITLQIQDNGQGFDMAETSSGFGLDNIRERAEMVGASVDIASALAQGTKITIMWKGRAKSAK